MRPLVLGGYGAVSEHVVSGLRALGAAVAHVAGRDFRRADRVIDLSQPSSVTRAVGRRRRGQLLRRRRRQR